MYQFVDLTPEQHHLRRQSLDWYGALAQVSVLIPILVIQLFALASWIHRTRRQKPDPDPPAPSSPYAKEQRLSGRPTTRDIRVRWRQTLWWLSNPIDSFGAHWGTNGQIIGASAWLAWLLLLCFVQTGDDYLHLTKRFGIVGASQLPLHYLLSLKSPYSPLQLLIRGSHESTIAIHQLLGRIITVLFYLHAAFYVYFFIQKDLLAVKLTQAYIICGVVGTIAFTLIGTTALAPVRKRNYRLFYVAHVTWATVILPVLYFHVQHIRLYIWETLLVYLLNAVLRYLSSTNLTGTLIRVPNTNLIDISFAKGASERGVFKSWQAGQHAYVSLTGHPFLRTFRSNPFTIASSPELDGQLRFVARVLDGNTAQLAKNTSSSQNMTLEGPYGLSSHSDKLLESDRILFVAGGIGATFIVPLYRQLLADLSPSKGSYRRQRVHFIWAARSIADVTWALPSSAQQREGFAERLQVYLTKNVDSVVQDDTVSGDEEGIELEEQKNLLANSENGSDEKGTAGMTIHADRPDVARIVDQTFAHGSTERVAVVVCGPRSLSAKLRKEVGRWVGRGREVWFWEESFAL